MLSVLDEGSFGSPSGSCGLQWAGELGEGHGNRKLRKEGCGVPQAGGLEEAGVFVNPFTAAESWLGASAARKGMCRRMA